MQEEFTEKAILSNFWWGEKYGRPLFRETMSKTDFVEVKRFIRLIKKLVTDKFIHIRERMKALLSNSTKKKKPTIIQFYNQNKRSVDVFDQRAKKYITYSASRQ